MRENERNEYVVPGGIGGGGGYYGNKIMSKSNNNSLRTKFEEGNKVSRKKSIEVEMAQNLERLPSKLDEDDEEEEEEDEEMEDGDEKITEGGYDPKEYESLDAPPEVTALFSNILLYTPSSIELDYKLKPFIPEYIPTVGDIDAFIKVSFHFSLSIRILDALNT